MSIEDFHRRYPADDNFVSEISGWEGFGTQNPVRFLSSFYLREGSYGLSALTREKARESDTNTVDVGKVKEEGPYLRNAGAIYFGVTLRAIEDMIVDGYFDQEAFNSVLQNKFTGSAFKPKTIPSPQEIPLTRNEEAVITRVAVSDKTFASFFRSEYAVLPVSLRAIIAETATFQVIKSTILPEYEVRARLLLKQRSSGS